ncbi:hypothetical protein TVAG_583230, partial [Trichomonas vaginalis G3]
MLNAIKGLVNNLSPEDKKGMLDMFGIKMSKKAKDITNKLALAIKNQGGTGSAADIFKNAKSFYDDYNGVMSVPASNSPVALDHDQRSHNRALMEMQPIYSDPPPKMLVNRRYETRYAINSKLVTPLAKVIELLFANNYFEPIRTGELCTYFTTMYNENLEEMIDLTYNERYCARVKKDWSSETKKDMKFPREHVFFADFEASTDGNIHKAYNICFMEDDDDGYTSIWGSDCASKFLEALPDKSLVYFHNLSYDVTFLMSQLEEITGTPIIKGSQTMQIQGKYKGKLLCFKDSYAIISTKLKRFPEMFHLTSGEKEVFPYNYYTEELVNTTKVGNIDDAMNH